MGLMNNVWKVGNWRWERWLIDSADLNCVWSEKLISDSGVELCLKVWWYRMLVIYEFVIGDSRFPHSLAVSSKSKLLCFIEKCTLTFQRYSLLRVERDSVRVRNDCGIKLQINLEKLEESNVDSVRRPSLSRVKIGWMCLKRTVNYRREYLDPIVRTW